MCEAGETPRRLFLDDYHIQSTTGLSRVYHQPVKHPVPVIMPDMPWEMGTNGGRSVNWVLGIEWSPTLGRYRMWYNAGDYRRPCYAESADGLTWTKPILNLSGTNSNGSGSTSNNIIDLGYAPTDGDEQRPVIIRDDLDPDTNRRYKAVVLRVPEHTMRLLFSSDGLRWTWSGDTLFTNSDEYRLLHDTLTGQYVFFGKVVDGDGHRNVTMATSVNFNTWSANPHYFEADATDQTLGNTRKAQWLSDTNRVQPTYINAQAWTDIYNMPAFIYEGLYLALPCIDDWTGSSPAPTQDGVLYPELMVSRDLAGPWNRLDRSPFINVSMKNVTNLYDQGMLHTGPQPVRVGDELWFYYTGFVHTHADPGGSGTNYIRSAIHLAKLRLDGFASLRAGSTTGTVVTTAVTVSGKSLYVNAAAQAGTLKAELLDADTGTAIPGYTLANSVALQADAVRAKLQWQGVTDLSALAGRSVKIRFSVQNADLYSFWFEEPTYTNSLGMELVRFEPGTFNMGTGSDLRIADTNNLDYDEQPAHSVTLTAPFYVLTGRVTKAQFDLAGLPAAPGDGRVSWDRATAFCAWLSQQPGETGLTYRLPMEAEWEYVRRNPETVADFAGEWVSDWHGPYRNVSLTNPAGPATGILKVVRQDATNRLSHAPSVEGQYMFRVVLDTASTNRFVYSPLPFNQMGVKQSTAPALQGPNPAVPYFTVRFAMPIPQDNDRQFNAALVGLDPAVVDHNHSPGFEVMPNGDALAIWFSGANGTEYGSKIRIVQARLRYGAEEFDMPELLFHMKDQNISPCLWREGTTNWLFTGYTNPTLFRISKSVDSGATWTMAPAPTFSGTGTNATPQPINSAFRAPDGTMYVPTDDSPGQSKSVLWRSQNNGLTWTDQGGRTAARHSTIVPLDGTGRLLCVSGKNVNFNSSGYMPWEISTDWGVTWQAETQSPFPRLGGNQRPSVWRLASGKLVMVGDATLSFTPTQPAGWTNGPGPYVALSADNGANWHFKALPVALKHESSTHLTLGYSTVRQAPNGVIHVLTTMTHPCLHYEFNEAWVYSADGDIAPETGGGTNEFYSENYPGGALKATWSARICPNGRYLLDGVETNYYENGIAQRVVTWASGRRTGEETLWASNGEKFWSWNHDTNSNVSTWTHWWSNGRKRLESQWDTYPAARDLPSRHFRGLVANGTVRHWDPAGDEVAAYAFANGNMLMEPPPAPAELWVTDVMTNGFTANWSSVAEAANYLLDVATDNGFGTFVTGYSNSNVGVGTAFAVTGLEKDETYYCRVRAGNAVGVSANSGTMAVTTTPPMIPVTVTETFDNATTTSAHGWTGSGNTDGGNNFGWSNTGNVLGSAGEAGGVFARSMSYRYFADTSIDTLQRAATVLPLSGSMKLTDEDFDGKFALGYFKAGDEGTNFVGLLIAEPSAGGDPFRGYLTVMGPGGASSTSPINLPQNSLLTFDLTWTGNTDGSGSLGGTVAGFSVGITAAAGAGTFNAFGLLCGGLANDDVSANAIAYSDDLTYAKWVSNAPPTITAQPANATVTAGQTATFSVTALGTPPLFYQWYTNSTPISGATGTSYTTPATTTNDNGRQFTVTVTNLYGAVTSSVATLTVNAAPTGGVVATGGTVTNYTLNNTNWTAHIFTTVGVTNLNVTAGGNVEVLVVAGGGGGSGGDNGQGGGGGGGAGGLVYSNAFPVVAGTNYTVTVGGGGSGGAGNGGTGTVGTNSVFGTLTALGGGNGRGGSGGSGGGGYGRGESGGSATQPGSSSAGYGNAGGKGNGTSSSDGGGGGGGGGAGAAGTNSATKANGGNGGGGRSYSLASGTSMNYAGGGGGGCQSGSTYGIATHGGGNGGAYGVNGANATPNTGGGGGGGGVSGTGQAGGTGGSGIVIVRYVTGGGLDPFEAWRQTYFTAEQLTNAAISSATADPDEDGLNNEQEYLAGTNPTNALSCLVIYAATNNPATSGTFVLSWQSVSGKMYKVMAATNLLIGFADLATNIQATPTVNVHTDSVENAGQRFYRIKLE